MRGIGNIQSALWPRFRNLMNISPMQIKRKVQKFKQFDHLTAIETFGVLVS